MNAHQERIATLLPAIAYGDAVGLPYEAKKAQDEHSVQTLREIRDHTFLNDHPPGTWSDDTHLSLAVAKSLIDANGFDIESQAAWHITAYEHTNGATHEPDLITPIVASGPQRGWGASTTSSVERLQLGVHPRESGEPKGAGNGVLMKLAPLIMWQIAQGIEESEAERQVIELTRMTHGAPEVVVSSLVHRRYLARTWHGEGTAPELLAASFDDAQEYEDTYDTSCTTSRILGKVAGKGAHISREDILASMSNENFYGFHAPETLLMAYASLARESRAPHGVLRAVELGGDSDSVGTIVAGILNCRTPGFAEVQTGDYQRLFDIERLERISQELAESALQN